MHLIHSITIWQVEEAKKIDMEDLILQWLTRLLGEKKAVLEMQAAGEQEKNIGNPTGFFSDKDCWYTCLGIHRGYRA